MIAQTKTDGAEPKPRLGRRSVPLLLIAPVWLLVAGLLLVTGLAPEIGAQELSELLLEPITAGLQGPVSIAHAGDGRLFLIEQGGRVRIYDGTEILAQPFLDLSSQVRAAGEDGLLDLAFPPDFANSGSFFAFYNRLDGDSVLSRFAVTGDPDLAAAESEVILLEIDQPSSGHNGGQIQFGPDGALYVSTGDGGGGGADPLCHAQNRDSLLGKILRLRVTGDAASMPPFYAVPADNPFTGLTSVRSELWALGLRNPWRFSFDRQDGDLWISDVGLSTRDEIDRQPAGSAGGANYGWKRMEGSVCLDDVAGCSTTPPACGSPAYTSPILELDFSDGTCAVIGGYVYRGAAIEWLQGRYLYGDFCTGTLWAARLASGEWISEPLSASLPGLRSFGEDVDGELYLVSATSLYRLVDGAGGSGPGRFSLAGDSFRLEERGGSARITVRRTGGSQGAVSVGYRSRGNSATAGVDFVAVSGILAWNDGDLAARTLTLPVINDRLVEPDETLSIELHSPTGGAVLDPPSTAIVTIVDDDVGSSLCTASDTVLCLSNQRFRVETNWRVPGEEPRPGRTYDLNPDAGYFWFFDENNPEVFVKLINACIEPFNHYWMFAAGLTSVEVTLTVTDTQNGQQRRYVNPLNQSFEPIQDVGAFATCP